MRRQVGGAGDLGLVHPGRRREAPVAVHEHADADALGARAVDPLHLLIADGDRLRVLAHDPCIGVIGSRPAGGLDRPTRKLQHRSRAPCCEEGPTERPNRRKGTRARGTPAPRPSGVVRTGDARHPNWGLRARRKRGTMLVKRFTKYRNTAKVASVGGTAETGCSPELEVVAMPAAVFTRTRFETDESFTTAQELGLDFTREPFGLEEFRMGMDLELVHGTCDLVTDVTHNDPVLTGKLVLAHLRKRADFYTRLVECSETCPIGVGGGIVGDWTFALAM